MEHALHRKFLTGKEGYLSKISLIPRNFPSGTPRKRVFSFPELRYSPLEKFGKICRIERDGINAIKFEAARTHFLSDVFV